MKLIKSYPNGNYQVSIYSDGTKIRETEEDEFIAEFPENIDIKISDQCDLGCAWCHENSTINGCNAHFNHEFLNTLKEGTELAIGGGNVFSNPNLIKFLSFCKSKGIIANITVNQVHATGKHKEELKHLINNGLVNGIGISYNNNSENLNSFFNELSLEKVNTNNIVIHTINGVQSFEDIIKIAGRDRKVLMLGYKDVRRGVEFRENYNSKIIDNQNSIYNNMRTINKSFKVVSFDNLAIEQLDMKRFLTDEQWEEFYMGDEGQHTMYIDLVKEEFSLNSCAVNKRYKIMSNIIDMFKIVKKESVE